MAKLLRRKKKRHTIYVMAKSFTKALCSSGTDLAKNAENNTQGVREGDKIVLLENRWVKHLKTGMIFKCAPHNYIAATKKER